MANGIITRTFTRARAFGWNVAGKNEDGSPRFERFGDVEFLSTHPSAREACRVLRGAGYSAPSKFCDFEIIGQSTYGITVERFLENATEVERLDNGRVVGGKSGMSD